MGAWVTISALTFAFIQTAMAQPSHYGRCGGEGTNLGPPARFSFKSDTALITRLRMQQNSRQFWGTQVRLVPGKKYKISFVGKGRPAVRGIIIASDDIKFLSDPSKAPAVFDAWGYGSEPDATEKTITATSQTYFVFLMSGGAINGPWSMGDDLCGKSFNGGSRIGFAYGTGVTTLRNARINIIRL